MMMEGVQLDHWQAHGMIVKMKDPYQIICLIQSLNREVLVRHPQILQETAIQQQAQHPDPIHQLKLVDPFH